jgi:hypothetical protein
LIQVDAFNGGELTALEDAEEVLGKLMGAQVSIRDTCRDANFTVTLLTSVQHVRVPGALVIYIERPGSCRYSRCSCCMQLNQPAFVTPGKAIGRAHQHEAAACM